MVNHFKNVSPKIVVTRTPMRISFAGGGTDLAEFYERDYGAVITTAIDKYVYVTVKRHGNLFDEPIRLNYSKSEKVNAINELENNIARECLKFLKIDPPIYISTVADLPASTGLGGSSSFAVGLLNALHAFRGERVSAGQLAEEAAHIEIDALREPIGKQDQYAAAFGGFNFLCFSPGGGVTVEPQRPTAEILNHLFDHILFFWTGLRRDASSVLTEQKANIDQKMTSLLQMRNHAHQLRGLISDGQFDAVQFGRVLNESWNQKRQLASTITTNQIDRWYNLAMESGAEGGKICGAGGGGFLVFIVQPERQQKVRQALKELIEVSVGHEVHGSQILLPFGE
jgi:D-glycero-alpha-D-manno-heptose-7-phosphate kinase